MALNPMWFSAPVAGFEPATSGLTVPRSTVELHRKHFYFKKEKWKMQGIFCLLPREIKILNPPLPAWSTRR